MPWIKTSNCDCGKPIYEWQSIPGRYSACSIQYNCGCRFRKNREAEKAIRDGKKINAKGR